MDDRYIYIYGTHAVTEALTHRPDVIAGLFLREGIQAGMKKGLLSTMRTIETFKGDNVPREVDKHAVHQGMIAKIDKQKLVVDFDDFKRTLEVTRDTSLALLGEVQDPHNVGAVIRSAAGFGLSGVSSQNIDKQG